jgi:hypothetical protein
MPRLGHQHHLIDLLTGILCLFFGLPLRAPHIRVTSPWSTHLGEHLPSLSSKMGSPHRRLRP